MRTSQDKECIFLWIMETVPFDEALEVYVQLPVWVAFKKQLGIHSVKIPLEVY